MQRSHAFAAFIALFSSVTACASNSATESTQARLDQLSSADAQITVVAEGGFGALFISHSVRRDDGAFVFLQKHICNAACPPLDSASGKLSATTTDSLFKAVLPAATALKNDYGTTRGGADMMFYEVRVVAGGATKTITADDGTMPPELRQIVSAVRQSIDAARR